ncbi:hypothetical protein VCHA50O407_100039 [Vibrio chagasii]|nr:hypothetical protein VCHA50O407_100039 [Vibrio chagasii]CAH7153960.1 hypothetical protein VCHA38O210_110024 [Vibrio chagasii]CAH7446560.1 hypothetical protein VCHA50P424_90154 [Vibrio chagasii]
MFNYIVLSFFSKAFNIMSFSKANFFFMLSLLGVKNKKSLSKLFFKLKGNEFYSKITRTGVIQIYSNRELYLIPTIPSSSKSMAKNYKFWLENNNKYSFLKYNMCSFSLNSIDYYSIEFMRPVANDFNLYDLKVSISTEEKNYSGIETEIEQAKNELNKLPNVDCETIKNFFEIKSYNGKVGFLHGDFHLGNIMMKEDKPMLIDLDRAKCFGPIDIDSIHFHLVDLQVKKKLFWLDELEIYFKCKKNSQLAKYSEDVVKLYLLYRVYFELNSKNKWLSNKLVKFINNI